MFTRCMIYEGWAIRGDRIAEGHCVADTTEAKTEGHKRSDQAKLIPSYYHHAEFKIVSLA